MIRLIKRETHTVIVTKESEPITLEMLGEIYPDLSKEDLDKKMQDIIDGQVDPDEFGQDGEYKVDFEWGDPEYYELTMIKGGFDVDYEFDVGGDTPGE